MAQMKNIVFLIRVLGEYGFGSECEILDNI